MKKQEINSEAVPGKIIYKKVYKGKKEDENEQEESGERAKEIKGSQRMEEHRKENRTIERNNGHVKRKCKKSLGSMRHCFKQHICEI